MPSTTKEVIFGYGHQNIKATHKTTLEITKERHVSSEGDCIIVVAADKALADLSSEFKESLRKSNTKLTMLIEAGETAERLTAYGCEKLPLLSSSDVVVRKSDYVCSRTLALHADKAAIDLCRELVEKLKNPKQKVKITLETSI